MNQLVSVWLFWATLPIALQSAPLPTKFQEADASGAPLPHGAILRLGDPRFNHGEAIQTMRVSRDGKWLVTLTGLEPSLLKIWEISTGKLHWVRAPRDAIKSFDISADGKFLALGQSKGQITVIELATRKQIFFSQLNNKGIHKVAISPKGNWVVASYVGNRWIALHDISGRAGFVSQIRTREGMANFQFSRDESALLMNSNKEYVAYDYTNSRYRPLHIIVESPSLLTKSAQGNLVAWIENKNTLVWSQIKPDGRMLKPFRKLVLSKNERFLSLSASPDGKYLLIGRRLEKPYLLVNTRLGKELATPSIPTAEFENLLFDGNHLAISKENSLRIWNLISGKQQINRTIKTKSLFGTVVALHGGKFMLGQGARWERWDIATAKRQTPKILEGHQSRVNSIRFLSGGQGLLSAGNDGKTILWDTITGEVKATYRSQRDRVLDIALLNQRNGFVSYSCTHSRDRCLLTYRNFQEPDRILKQIDAPSVPHYGFTVSNSDQPVYLSVERHVNSSKSFQHTVNYLKKVKPISHAEVYTFFGENFPKAGILPQAWRQPKPGLNRPSIYGRFLYAHDVHRKVNQVGLHLPWHSPDGGQSVSNKIYEFPGERFTSATFSKEGALLAATDTKKLRIWRITSKKPVLIARSLLGGDLVVKMEFSPDNRQLATLDSSGSVVLWSVNELSYRTLIGRQ